MVPSDEKTTVLVVDDSTFMRRALRRMLESDPTIRVVGDVADGSLAVEAVKRLNPDVVTLDVKMPGLDGMQVLERLMREHPVRVLMVSSLTTEGGEMALRALESGAVDFIDKSTCHTAMDIGELAATLVQKVKVIRGVDLSKVTARRGLRSRMRRTPISRPIPQENPVSLVVIGASTGGPIVLEQLLVRLPTTYHGAILVVQHMPPGFTRSLAERLNQKCAIGVKEAEEDDVLCPGWAFVAPSGYQLTLRRLQNRYRVVLGRLNANGGHCPSVDVVMGSAAEVWDGKILGVILTGMGQDGTEGARLVKEKGGAVLAQDEASCVVFGMPRSAHQAGFVDRLLALDDLSEQIRLF